MSADAGAVPAPGSDAAIKVGCTCYVADIGNFEPRLVWDTDGCPVHDPDEVCLSCGKPGRGQPCDDCLAELDDPTMRPRTGAGGAHAE